MNSEMPEPHRQQTSETGADLDVIRRTLIAVAGLTALLCLVAGVYLGGAWACGLAAGSAVGMLNLIFLTALVREIVRPGKRHAGRIAALLALKLPVVYGGLALLLLWRWPPVAAVVGGFSLVLVVIVLKAGGRALIASGWIRASRQERARPESNFGSGIEKGG